MLRELSHPGRSEAAPSACAGLDVVNANGAPKAAALTRFLALRPLRGCWLLSHTLFVRGAGEPRTAKRHFKSTLRFLIRKFLCLFFQPLSSSMPHLPIPPSPREANAKEQYEALGRFVEAFEGMVDEVRHLCIDRIWGAVIADTGLDLALDEQYRKGLIEISFHNQSMTAKPLWDTMRSIIAEIIVQPDNFHADDYANFKNLLGFMEGEYSSLYNKRNELLHGTWLIGFGSTEDPEGKKFRVRKFKTTADGLAQAKELPQDVTELTSLTNRCDQMRSWIAEIDWCLRKPKPLSDHFKREEKKWYRRLTPSSAEWTALPERRS